MSERCKATTALGHRCKNKTAQSLPYCWIHMKQKDHLQIKPSQIRGAGKGLFAQCSKNENQVCFRRGERAAYYSGELLDEIPQNKEYVLNVNNNRYLDSVNKLNYPGRYINDARGSGKRNNVQLTGRYYRKDNKIVSPVIALKTIKHNDELYAAYGRSYWDERRRNAKNNN